MSPQSYSLKCTHHLQSSITFLFFNFIFILGLGLISGRGGIFDTLKSYFSPRGKGGADESLLTFILIRYRVIQNLRPPSPVKSTWTWVELTVIPNNATNLKNICQKSWCGSLSLAQDRIFWKKCICMERIGNFADFAHLPLRFSL